MYLAWTTHQPKLRTNITVRTGCLNNCKTTLSVVWCLVLLSFNVDSLFFSLGFDAFWFPSRDGYVVEKTGLGKLTALLNLATFCIAISAFSISPWERIHRTDSGMHLRRHLVPNCERYQLCQKKSELCCIPVYDCCIIQTCKNNAMGSLNNSSI